MISKLSKETENTMGQSFLKVNLKGNEQAGEVTQSVKSLLAWA